jgi:hypothetical protein
VVTFGSTPSRPLAPQYPTIEAIEAGPEGVSGADRRSAQQPLMELGEIATAYLKRFAEQANTTDKIFGIHDTGGKFYIGNTEIMIDGGNITLMSTSGSASSTGGPASGTGKTYRGTPGLWELIVSKQPSSDIYTLGDLENYQEILVNTNALKRNNNPDEAHPKSSRNAKWVNLLKPIWEKYYPRSAKSTGGPTLTACTVVQSSIMDDSAFPWEHAIFGPPPRSNPLTDRYEILHN